MKGNEVRSRGTLAVSVAVLVIVSVLLIAGCKLGSTTYFVKEVDKTTVTCWEDGVAGSGFTKEWDPIAQLAPEIGSEWL